MSTMASSLAARLREFAAAGGTKLAIVARLGGRHHATVSQWAPTDPNEKPKFPRFDVLADFSENLLLSVEYWQDNGKKYSIAWRKLQKRAAEWVAAQPPGDATEPPGARVFRVLDKLVELAPPGMLRDAKGALKAKLIAVHMGLSADALPNLREHPENMQPPTLSRAAEFLGVSYTWLETGRQPDPQRDLGPWQHAVERWEAEGLRPEDLLVVTDAAKVLKNR